jgi:HD superfamily phosphodiesterase
MNDLVEAVSSYVILFLSENLSNELVFHNINHTYEVVAVAREIGSQCYLSDNEMLALEVAAWFHDCGYANTYLGHENESKKIAEDFLENYGCENGFISSVLNCIESTKYPPKPSSLIEKVLCDADLYHLTRANYPKYEKALRREFEIFLKLIYTDEEWLKKNCWFLSEHTYYTDFGEKVLSKFKETNIQMHCPK